MASVAVPYDMKKDRITEDKGQNPWKNLLTTPFQYWENALFNIKIYLFLMKRRVFGPNLIDLLILH